MLMKHRQNNVSHRSYYVPQSSVNENLDNKNTAEQQVFHQELIERVQTPMTRDEAIDCLIQQLDKHGYVNDCLT